MDYLEKIPEEVSLLIQSFIDDFKESNPDFFGSNIVIREDIFSILEKTALVVFFPLSGEENDGFHVKRTVKGEIKDFVYINTAKAVEKQVFTAAHELGHRLGIEDYIAKKYPSFDIKKYKENVVNRFAALLLLPEEEFLKVVTVKVKEIQKCKSDSEDGFVLTLTEAFKLIAFLMDYFFVPFKTVVYRLSEANIISVETRNQILKNFKQSLLDECIVDGKYLKLNKPNNKKSINGYSELLDKAEQQKLFPINKINKIREQFEIPDINNSKNINLTLSIKE